MKVVEAFIQSGKQEALYLVLIRAIPGADTISNMSCIDEEVNVDTQLVSSKLMRSKSIDYKILTPGQNNIYFLSFFSPKASFLH